ncbi:aldehyde ferredoxin oxidoreductase [Desulfonema ishimotonii]|uniref:Aldehyde ferredoxin oxidoreductase n=1 Tax=Desulfonema ishimotonii TaxID=45657 RepID=A0A401FXN1_9BACT|nr:aldehyde ferredoxin oxidoreductase family protein [Desulfonema ishimotonii]GBC61706.1 aldehyde ferredoxin oxidoreductase [Desulfonema ishimotonii]
MNFGGQILETDLSSGSQSRSGVTPDMARKYLGGRGLNAGILYDRLAPGTAPLGPDNLLMLSCGLLTGTHAPVSARLHVNALSPQTGLLGSSNVGGGFGAALRSCGIQSLIIRGQSPKWVCLFIDGGRAELRDAEPLVGLDTWETQQQIRADIGDRRLKMMVIGPGGENGVRFACMMTDRDHAAGRTGMGAVMGSKKLKAVVIRGRRERGQRPDDATRAVLTRYVKKIRNAGDFKAFSTFGGAGYVKWCDDMGFMATRNYRESRFEGAEALDGKHLRKYVTRSRGCYHCPVQCKAEMKFDRGRFKDMTLARPEFEPMITFGAKCGLSDPETVVFLDNLCSRLGIDSISTGTVIAFAIDLYERGILRPEQCGGLQLRWGDGAVMETLVRQIVARKGLGKLLSQGVRHAAAVIGNSAERFAPHVKGLELTAYNPREIMGTALAYAVCNRGGDFNNVYASLEYGWPAGRAEREFGTSEAVDIHAIRGKGALIRWAAIVNAVLDSLGLCKVPVLSLIGRFDLRDEAELVSALTGWPSDVARLFEIGERIVNTERLFNLRHGMTGRDDRLPPMFDDVPLAPMLKDFYAAMGWDEKGRPDTDRVIR